MIRLRNLILSPLRRVRCGPLGLQSRNQVAGGAPEGVSRAFHRQEIVRVEGARVDFQFQGRWLARRYGGSTDDKESVCTPPIGAPVAANGCGWGASVHMRIDPYTAAARPIALCIPLGCAGTDLRDEQCHGPILVSCPTSCAERSVVHSTVGLAIGPVEIFIDERKRCLFLFWNQSA